MPVRETFTVEAEVQGDRAVISSIERVEQAVDEAEASSSDFGDTVSKEMRLASTSAEEAEQELRATAAAADRVTSSTRAVGSAASGTATNLGFELVQGASDARFGMVGLANQLPLIQEQFQRLRQQSGSTSGALSALAATFTNPATGVVAAVTLLLTFKQPLTNFFTDSEESAKSFTDQMESASGVLKSLNSELDGLKEDKEALDDALEGIAGFFGDGLSEATDTILSEGAGRRGQLRAIENLQASLRGSSEEAQRLRNVLDAAGVDVQTLLTENVRDSEEAFKAVVTEVRNSEEALREVAQDPAAALAETPEALARAIEDRVGAVRESLQAQQDSPIFDTTEVEAAEEELQTLRDAFEELIESQEGVSRTDPAFDELRRRAVRLQRRLEALRAEAPDLVDAPPSAEEVRGADVEEAPSPDPDFELAGSPRELGNQFQAAAESGDEVNQQLVQGVRLAGQLGETLVTAFQRGEVEANQLLGQVLQIVGSAVAIANPAAGAGISAVGGLIGSFDEGGYTGAGPRSAPAGVVHRGEYVMPAEVVNAFGVDAMRAIHQAASKAPSRSDLEAVAGVPGYATGGLVTEVTRPAGTATRSDRMEEAARQAATETARQVAEEVASRPVRVFIGGRAARDIQTEAQEYQQKRTPQQQ